jgi:membrane protein DedA with SNARE-associated domain
MAIGTAWWLIGIICAVWVIHDVLSEQKKMDSTHKALWIIGALLFSIITAIVYYLVVKKK